MNTRNLFNATAILVLFMCGCVTNRTAEITAARVELTSSGINGITTSAAVDVFQSVARQLALPVQGPQEVVNGLTGYSARAASSRVQLVMWLEPKRNPL
jgi:hypothetical protein